VHATPLRRLHWDQVEDGWVIVTGCVGPGYPYFSVFYVLCPRGNSRAHSWFARFSDPILVSFTGLRHSIFCESLSFPSSVFFDCSCHSRAECSRCRQFRFCGPRALIPARLHHCGPVRCCAIPTQDFLNSVRVSILFAAILTFSCTN
jgi:hypothetical protein